MFDIKAFSINFLWGVALVIILGLNIFAFGAASSSIATYVCIGLMDFIFLACLLGYNYIASMQGNFNVKSVVINRVIPLFLPLALVVIYVFIGGRFDNVLPITVHTV